MVRQHAKHLLKIMRDFEVNLLQFFDRLIRYGTIKKPDKRKQIKNTLTKKINKTCNTMASFSNSSRSSCSVAGEGPTVWSKRGLKITIYKQL
jgi:hypothetical protein